MRIILTALAMLLLAPAAIAQQPAPAPAPATAPSPALAARAAELVALLNGGGEPAAMFHSDFLAQVPEAQIRAISTQVTGGVGKALRVASVEPASATAATVTIACERGLVTMRLAIDSAPPNRIIGLRITGAGAAEASIPAVIDTLKALPGATGFALADLGDGKPVIAAGHNTDRPLAAGSAFKLVILAELVRVIAAGERGWDDQVTLDGTELPGGAYTQSPKGTPVTLRELTEKMISVSDNSATDVLLATLGRERVEAVQRTVGVADPARNRPFLTTMEAFKLKGIAQLREPWLAADERGRRRLLAKVAAAPTAELSGLFADGKPVAIQQIEWFLSPADLVRTMDWLRRHTTSGPAAEARRILGINPGVAPAIAQRYAFVGYKGGSEPGVINMTLLLQTRGGSWRVVTGGWENPAAAVEDLRFAGLISRATELAAAK